MITPNVAKNMRSNAFSTLFSPSMHFFLQNYLQITIFVLPLHSQSAMVR